MTYNSNLLGRTHPEQLADSARRVLRLVADGQVRVDITAEYDLADLAMPSSGSPTVPPTARASPGSPDKRETGSALHFGGRRDPAPDTAAPRQSTGFRHIGPVGSCGNESALSVGLRRRVVAACQGAQVGCAEPSAAVGRGSISGWRSRAAWSVACPPIVAKADRVGGVLLGASFTRVFGAGLWS